MSERVLILAFSLFFALTAALLFWENNQERDPAFEKDWWLVAFVEPDNEQSLSFRIENYGPDNDFLYRVLTPQGTILEEDSVRLLSKESFDVLISEEVPAIVEIKRQSDGEIKTLFRK